MRHASSASALSSSGRVGTLGLLTQLGGGLRDFERNGQLDNLLRYHLAGYLQAFDRISLFSGVDERIEDYTDDAELRARITVWPKPPRIPYRAYALSLPWSYRRQVRECAVVRVLQATAALPAAVARTAYGIPYVTTFGYRYAEFSRIEGSRLKASAVSVLERIAVRCADAVIVTTEAMRDYVERLDGSTRVVLIPNGIDTDLFSPVSSPAIRQQSGARRLLFVGRLEAQKNLPTLLEALAIVGRAQAVELTLVGEGSLREPLERQARTLGVPLTFRGVVANGTLPTHYRAADVFVLPSLAEGHPKALLEAMSCGLCCVVSDCQGNRSLVAPGVTGFTHAPDDVQGLAELLTRVLTNDALRDAIGRRAREHVVRRFDIHATVRATCALLSEVARRPEPSPVARTASEVHR